DRPQEALSEQLKAVALTRGEETVGRRGVRGGLEAVRREGAVHVARRLRCRVHECHVLTHDVTDGAGEHWVVRAAKDDGVHSRVAERRKVLAGHGHYFWTRSDPRFDEFDEARACLARH